VRDASGLTVGTIAQGGRILARGLKGDHGVLMVVLDAGSGRQCRLSYQLPAEQGNRPDAVSMGTGVCSELAAAQDNEPALALVLAREIQPQ